MRPPSAVRVRIYVLYATFHGYPKKDELAQMGSLKWFARGGKLSRKCRGSPAIVYEICYNINVVLIGFLKCSRTMNRKNKTLRR